MNHVPLSSTHLSSIAHDGQNKKLEVRFQNGQLYTYHNVPRDIYVKLLAHPSPGRGFNELIKDKFSFSK